MDYWNIAGEALQVPTDKRIEYERIKDYNNKITTAISVDLNCNVIDHNLRLSRSILSWTLKLVKSDGTNIAATSKATLVNNAAAATWERIKLSANTIEVYSKNLVGICSTVSKLVRYSDDYSRSVASREFWYPDTAPSNESVKYKYDDTKKEVARNVNYNKGYAKRFSLTKDSKEIRISVPMCELVEFFQIDRVFRGVNFQLTLFKSNHNTSNEMLTKLATDNTDYKVIISDLEWIIPKITPNEMTEATLTETLHSNKSIKYMWQGLNAESVPQITSTSFSYTLHMPHKPVYVYIVFQSSDKYTASGNNMIFDAANVRRIEVALDHEKFEPIRCDFSTATMNYDEAYNAFIRAGYREMDTDTGTIVSKTTFASIYPIYCFDVSNMPDQTYATNPSHLLKIDAEFSASPNCKMFIVYSYDKEMLLQLSQGRIHILD